jgi:hypothetical protein
VSGESPSKRILTLKRRDRLDRMSPTSVRSTNLRHTEVLDLTFMDEVSDCASHFVDRHIWVDAILIEQVDEVGVAPFEGGFSHGSDSLRLSVRPLRRYSVFEAEPACDGHLVSNGSQRFANDFLVRKGSVSFRGIEDGYAAVTAGRRSSLTCTATSWPDSTNREAMDRSGLRCPAPGIDAIKIYIKTFRGQWEKLKQVSRRSSN